MQQLRTELNIKTDLKSKKINKKNKQNSNSKNLSKNSVQFEEILGQVSIPTPTLTEIKVKETKTFKPEIRTGNAIFKELGGVPTKSDPNEIQKSKNQIDLKGHITEKNSRILKKSAAENSKENILIDSKSQTLVQKASFNNNALEKSENRGRISDIQISQEKISLKLNMESKTAPDSTGIILDKLLEADIQNNAEIESKEDNIKISKVETQINGGIIHNKVGTAENLETQAIDKKVIQKQDANLKDQIKQENSIPISKLDGYLQTEQVKKETEENAAESDTPKAKTEIYNSQIITSKTGLLDMTKVTGPNLDKTMSSQSQTDLIVTKMIDQIKTGPGSLEVSLKPEYLGKLNILFQSNEGSILIKVVAQNVDAVNLLNSSLQNIKENLEQQGIKVQQIEVNLANQEKHGNQTGYSRDGTKHQNSFGKPKFSNYEPRETISLLPYKLNILA